MSTRQFSFPILTTEQVLSCMEEYGLLLTDQDIKKPQAEKIAVIYERFVEDIMGVFRVCVVSGGVLNFVAGTT